MMEKTVRVLVKGPQSSSFMSKLWNDETPTKSTTVMGNILQILRRTPSEHVPHRTKKMHQRKWRYTTIEGRRVKILISEFQENKNPDLLVLVVTPFNFFEELKHAHGTVSKLPQRTVILHVGHVALDLSDILPEAEVWHVSAEPAKKELLTFLKEVSMELFTKIRESKTKEYQRF
jgi:hypothetical protein